MPCYKYKRKLKGGNIKMPKVRIKGYLRKVPGRGAKVRVRPHLMKVKRR